MHVDLITTAVLFSCAIYSLVLALKSWREIKMEKMLFENRKRWLEKIKAYQRREREYGINDEEEDFFPPDEEEVIYL